MQFKNLKDLFLKFKDEDVCREYMVQRRWSGKPECPKCQCDKVYKIEGGKRYKCANNKCYYRFSVITGTYFENSAIPLSTWFPAIYLIVAHKKGISSVQLARDLGVTQKTAWFMLQRIRESLKDKGNILLGNTIELDTTFMGGKISNKHNKERAEWAKSDDKLAKKYTVLAMIERNGLVITKHISSEVKKEIYPVVKERVLSNSIIVTDTAKVYNKLNSMVINPQVNHRKDEYVRGEWYTNTVEGFFSLLKRSIYGIYHQVSPKHLQRYCNETSYRYNTRNIQDPEKFDLVLSSFEGRMTYCELINKEIKKRKKYIKYTRVGHHQFPVKQMLDGKVVAEFKSTREASSVTGIHRTNITLTLKNKRPSAGGYQWIYANLGKNNRDGNNQEGSQKAN